MSKIRIMGLGGIGENGKNMYVVEVDDRIFILDAGLKYPDVDMYGVDAVIPDISYLVENKDRVEGIFLSHGHEDHIGAIPYLLRKIPTRVFGTHFTICLVENLLQDNKMNIKDYHLYRINENKTLTFNNVTINFFNLTHSLPETVGISISTPDGAIVYATDFNFNTSNEVRYLTSFDKITDIGKKKVLAVMAESVGTSSLGRIANDTLLEYNFKEILSRTKMRIIVAAYSTDLSRIQKIINLAVQHGKKIAIIGQKAERIIDVAVKSNYLAIPDASFTSLKYIDDTNTNLQNDLVVIVTGVRNEPYSMLVRMVKKEDRLIHLTEDDSVVVMCPPVPGTEKQALNCLNLLSRYNASVTNFGKDVLTSAHASREDLRLLYAMLKPSYLIPIKGEYRHMYEHAEIARSLGYNDKQIIQLENGLTANFVDGVLMPEQDREFVGHIFVDGTLTGSINEQVIHDRETLAEEGAILIYITMNSAERKLLEQPKVLTKGFCSSNQSDFIPKLTELVERLVTTYFNHRGIDESVLENQITTEANRLVAKMTKNTPIVIPVITNVTKLSVEEKKTVQRISEKKDKE
jgi:ribonuclease J